MEEKTLILFQKYLKKNNIPLKPTNCLIMVSKDKTPGFEDYTWYKIYTVVDNVLYELETCTKYGKDDLFRMNVNFIRESRLNKEKPKPRLDIC